MRIVTYTCPACGTIVAGNVLESNRVMKCPGLGCERELAFEYLEEPDRAYVREAIAEVGAQL
jgi:hypothetical protein